MRWLKSTTQKSYKFEGKTIPKAVTENNDFLALSDEEFLKWSEQAVIKSLIKNGALFITTKEPSSPTKQLQDITAKNAELILQNTQLKEELKKVQESIGDNSEITSLRAALERQRSEDQAEIMALRDTKDKEIAALKAQLEKLQEE